MTKNNDFASFRDPSGYIYYENNLVYRKINKCYIDNYNFFIESGLYQRLIDAKLLIEHREIEKTSDSIILNVPRINFISYPYEWCFLELKDAALLTLNIEKISLEYGMTLKDATSYNVQFYQCHPIFIDTLSFEKYEEGTPWGAYGQFCRHFMAPLLLMSHVNENLNSLLRNYIDGIPLDIAKDILSWRGGLTSLEHVKLHNNSIKKNNETREISTSPISKQSLINLIDMMIRQIEKLKPRHFNTEWENYYTNTNYDADGTKDKEEKIRLLLKNITFTSDDISFDLGANNGKYSRILAEKCSNVISFDIDYNAVNANYLACKKNNETNLLPLLLDLTNPTPSIGFNLEERQSILKRSNGKCVLALALIHHICISNNVPFTMFAENLKEFGEYLIIEFVPKEDSKVQELLKTRLDIFPWYNTEEFEKSFKKYYKIIKKENIQNSKRLLYLMERNYEK